MTYIGTFGDMDPNRQTRQLQQFGGAMQLAMANANRRKQDKEAEREREIQRLMDMADRYPDAAANYGESLVSKYGQDVPYLRGIVDSIKNKDEVRQTAEKAGQKWVQGVKEREAPLRPFADPNSPVYQMPIGPLPPLGPQIGQMVAGMAEGKLRQLPSEVANELPFDEREAARLWAKNKGRPFPPPETLFDPYRDLPQAARAETAAATGEWNIPQAAEVAAIASGRQPSAGSVLAADVRSEEGVRAEERIEIEHQRQDYNERKLKLEERKETRMAREGSDTGADAKATKAAVGDVADWLVDDTDLLAEEWGLGLKEQAAGDRDGKVTPEVREEYTAAAGPQPKPLLKSQANLIANRIAKELGEDASPATIQQYADAARAKYLRLVTAGLSREKAVQHVLNGTEPGR